MLINILHFKDCNSEEEVLSRMKEIANELLNRYELEHKGQRWEITAIEFYLRIPSMKNKFSFFDPFAHANDEQLKSGTFYVHDDCRRACNYSGIDITCGSQGETNIHGGILIREINRVDGSATAVKAIVRNLSQVIYNRRDTWNEAEKEILQTIHRKKLFEGPLKLVKKVKKTDYELYRGKRELGISAEKASKRSEMHLLFFNKKLRFASWKTKKQVFSMELINL